MVHGWFGWRFKAEVLWLILYKLYNKLYNINDIIKYSTTNVFFCFYSVPIRLIIILVVPFCSCGKRSWLKWQFCLLCRNLFFVILSYRMEFNLTWTYVQAFKVMFIVLNNPLVFERLKITIYKLSSFPACWRIKRMRVKILLSVILLRSRVRQKFGSRKDGIERFLN